MAYVVGKVSDSVISMASNLRANLDSKGAKHNVDVYAVGIMAFAVCILYAPLELGQLEFAFIGALFYAGLQASRNMTRNRLGHPSRTKLGKATTPKRDTSMKKRVAPCEKKCDANPAGKQDYRQVSVQPVSAPKFGTDDLDAQVDELLGQIRPSREGNQLVHDISLAVKKAVRGLLPEAEVMGFASADALRGTAFAVAIPEVEIVLSASPDHIVDRLSRRATRPLPQAIRLDARKLQKSMLRACTDELALTELFKFRRSAFKGQEPKVTLVAQIQGKTIPIDFSVNTLTPLYNAALLSESDLLDSHAKDLILLVRRWAKDRGISHAAKGHLPPYAWTLLTIYFLQVREAHTPLVPKLTSIKQTLEVLHEQQKQRIERNVHGNIHAEGAGSSMACSPPVTALLKEFLCFYTKSFNWRDEAVSVRAASREAPTRSLPLQIVTLEDGSNAVAPSIEDPFNPRHNLSDCMTGVSLRRLKEEFARGDDLVSRQAPLSELIEPWVPPEFAPSTQAAHMERDDEE